jgi:GTP-binding protein Era
VLDLALLMPLQIAGVLKIASIYNHAWNKDRAKELIGVLGSRMLLRSASRSLSKLVPGFGSVVGASVASAGTYAILKAAQIYFEHGATLDSKGREVLKKVYDEAEKKGSDFFSSEKMKEFRKLQLKYQSGAISKEEFDKKLEEFGRTEQP